MVFQLLSDGEIGKNWDAWVASLLLWYQLCNRKEVIEMKKAVLVTLSLAILFFSLWSLADSGQERKADVIKMTCSESGGRIFCCFNGEVVDEGGYVGRCSFCCRSTLINSKEVRESVVYPENGCSWKCRPWYR